MNDKTRMKLRWIEMRNKETNKCVTKKRIKIEIELTSVKKERKIPKNFRKQYVPNGKVKISQSCDNQNNFKKPLKKREYFHTPFC